MLHMNNPLRTWQSNFQRYHFTPVSSMNESIALITYCVNQDGFTLSFYPAVPSLATQCDATEITQVTFILNTYKVCGFITEAVLN